MPVARSLGRAGVRVEAVGAAADPIRHSRHCRAFAGFDAGSGLQDPWWEWLSSRSGDGAVLLPCSDDGLELIARHRGELTALGYVVPEADDEVLLSMLDKDRTYALAHLAGVATPMTYTVRREEDMDDRLDRFEYPCGLKPVHAHLFARRSGVKAKIILANDRAELDRELRRMLALGLEMQVTEIVRGGDDRIVAYFTYLDEGGRPLMHFTNRKLRQLPIHFGVGCYVVGEWMPDVAELGLRFVQGVGLRGIAHVEFKRDVRDGQLRLIECNHRFNLAIGLLCASGLDLPLFTYQRLLGRSGPPLDSPRYGVRLWHPVPDFRAFLGYRSAGELTARAWVRSILHRQRFSLFDWQDPLPSLVDHLSGVWELARRTRAQRRFGSGSRSPQR